MGVQIKRIYEAPSDTDGYRVLVDRLWPRGVSKEKALLDMWLKDIAPSSELRTWFGHDPARFDEFSLLYKEELDKNTTAVNQLLGLIAEQPALTLLYAAHDPKVNHAQVLLEYLKQRKDK